MKSTICEITCGDYSARINASRGANCISLRNKKYNAEILREPNDIDSPDNPYLYGMPILYPVNRIHTGKFEFEGRQYRFPVNEPSTDCFIHGELHKAEFEILNKGADFVICEYKSHGDYLGFPHDFSVRIEYMLRQDGLHQTTVIRNLSAQNMPSFLGYHTTFNIPFIPGSNADDITVLTDVGDEIERNMSVYLPTGRILPPDGVTEQINNGTLHPLGDKMSRHYKIGDKNRIEITDNAKGVKIIYQNDEKYKFRLLYNGNADRYICIEPMSCMANCQNSPFDREYAGFDYIAPGQEKAYTSVISIAETVK